MCGRFTFTVSAAILADLFDLEEPPDFKPRYNIAPTQTHPIVRSGDGDRREWAQMRWGLIPHWAKDMNIGARMINARSETAAQKPSFRTPLDRRRCLVPTDGFYEWQKTEFGKQPFHIRFTDRRPFAFAGLWERWSRGEGDPLETFTILTTSPNEVAAQVHDRMPVIIARQHWPAWLQSQPMTPEKLEGLFSPCPEGEMEAVPVSRRVNSPHNDDPECLAPPE